MAKAEAGQYRDAFLQRVKSIPVFSVSTSAYLHAKGRMPLYQGMKLSADETQIPLLIGHLHSVTLEQSYESQIVASLQRLRTLHDQVRRFFLDKIRQIELDSNEARREWEALTNVWGQAIRGSRHALEKIDVRYLEALQQRCGEFESRLADLDTSALKALGNIFTSWESINWRSLQAAVRAKGVWFSHSLQREFNFNRDVARAYLDLLPFVWDDFFGVHLSELSADVADGTQLELRKAAERLNGAMNMLRHQPTGIAESMETSLRTAGESFQLQTGQTRAALQAHIQETRQTLSNGIVEAASNFMQAAYSRAGSDKGGSGMKRRMLGILVEHAKRHASALFTEMRRGLNEGVVELQASMTPQLSKMVKYGTAVLDQFGQNVTSHQIVTPEERAWLQRLLDHLPAMEDVRRERLPQETH